MLQRVGAAVSFRRPAAAPRSTLVPRFPASSDMSSIATDQLDGRAVRSWPARSWRLAGPWTWAFVGFFVLASIVMLATFLDYGLTWDEEVQHIYGDLVLRWYQTLGQERGAVTFGNLYYYGGFFEILAELGVRLLPFGVYESRHLVNVLFALMGVLGTYATARYLDTPRAGFFAAAFLLLLPEYYGHAFNNPKDIPLAAVSVWALLTILKGAREVPTVSWRSVAWTALALGLVLAVRVGSAFYAAYLVLGWGGALLLWHWNAQTRTRAFLQDAGRLTARIGAVGVGAWLVMLVLWPYGQISPIKNTLRGIFVASRFGWNHDVRYMGLDIPARELPPSYLPVQIGIRLPEYFYVALLCGVVALGIIAWRKRDLWRHRAAWRLDHWVFGIPLVALAVVFPLVLAIGAGSTVYDGMRHFMFILPPLAVLAGVGMSRFLALPIARPVRIAAVAAVSLGAVLVVGDMAALHPYQSVYFNRVFAGGLPGAVGKFETDYWGASYREAAEWTFENVTPPTGRRAVVKNCSKDFLSSYFIDRKPAWKASFTGAGPEDKPDIMLGIERWHCHEQGGTLLHVVRRQGAPLAYVFDMTGPGSTETPARSNSR